MAVKKAWLVKSFKDKNFNEIRSPSEMEKNHTNCFVNLRSSKKQTKVNIVCKIDCTNA